MKKKPTTRAESLRERALKFARIEAAIEEFIDDPDVAPYRADIRAAACAVADPASHLAVLYFQSLIGDGNAAA